MNCNRPLSLIALALIPLSGCVEDEQAPADTEGSSTAATGDESGSVAQVRYYEEVRPILAEHCGSCHAEGAVAPFALDTYERAVEWGPALAASVQSRAMPPFGVNNDGSCNTFAEARWLTDEQIATLTQWVDGGFEEGDASLPPPTAPVAKELSGAVTELVLPEYEPQVVEQFGGFEDYHCFAMEPQIDEPRFITGFDVIPGDPTTVHHVLGFRVIPGLLGNDATMAELDAQSPDVPGWECFGAAGDGVLPSGVPVTWAPGVGATLFPEGVGMRVDPGDLIVVQVHYNLAEGGGPDQTRVQLELAEEVERVAFQTLWDPFLFSRQFGGTPAELEPGTTDATYEWEDTIEQMLALDSTTQIPAEGFEVLALLPHMHERGRTMSIQIETADGMQCGADVDRWDFDWQQTYFLDEPISVTKDDKFHVACQWDTSGDVEPILPGFGTNDEMCLVGAIFAPK